MMETVDGKKGGATPSTPLRTVEALGALFQRVGEIRILTYPGKMGEKEAHAAGFQPRVIGRINQGKPPREAMMCRVE